MSATAAAEAPPATAEKMTADEKRVIFASSLGTVFEWYDFYLFGVLTAVIGAQFFAPLGRGIRLRKNGLAGALWSRCQK